MFLKAILEFEHYHQQKDRILSLNLQARHQMMCWWHAILALFTHNPKPSHKADGGGLSTTT